VALNFVRFRAQTGGKMPLPLKDRGFKEQAKMSDRKPAVEEKAAVRIVHRDDEKDEVTLEVRMTFERVSIPSSRSNFWHWLRPDESRFHGVRFDAEKVIELLGGKGP